MNDYLSISSSTYQIEDFIIKKGIKENLSNNKEEISKFIHSPILCFL